MNSHPPPAIPTPQTHILILKARAWQWTSSRTSWSKQLLLALRALRPPALARVWGVWGCEQAVICQGLGTSCAAAPSRGGGSRGGPPPSVCSQVVHLLRWLPTLRGRGLHSVEPRDGLAHLCANYAVSARARCIWTCAEPVERLGERFASSPSVTTEACVGK